MSWNSCSERLRKVITWPTTWYTRERVPLLIFRRMKLSSCITFQSLSDRIMDHSGGVFGGRHNLKPKFKFTLPRISDMKLVADIFFFFFFLVSVFMEPNADLERRAGVWFSYKNYLLTGALFYTVWSHCEMKGLEFHRSRHLIEKDLLNPRLFIKLCED